MYIEATTRPRNNVCMQNINEYSQLGKIFIVLTIRNIYREKVIYLQEGGEETAEIMANYPREPPPIQPPQFKKTDVYENNMAVFEVIDETAKTAATETYKTFSNLVRVLVGRCASELDKARAIFRLALKASKTVFVMLLLDIVGISRRKSSTIARGSSTILRKATPEELLLSYLEGWSSGLKQRRCCSRGCVRMQGSMLLLSKGSARQKITSLPRNLLIIDGAMPGMLFMLPEGGDWCSLTGLPCKSTQR